MEHEELIKQWAEDSKIDSTKVLEELYRIPIIHSKYLGKLQDYKIRQRKRIIKYQKIRALKTKYYSGEMSEEELKILEWKQYQFKKPLKSEMENIIAGDPDIIQLEEEVQYLATLISSCESIMKEIHSRNFLFKSIVEMIKFEAGA